MKDSEFKKPRDKDRLPSKTPEMKKNERCGSWRSCTVVSTSVSFKNNKHSNCALSRSNSFFVNEKPSKPGSSRRKKPIVRLSLKLRTALCNNDSNQL